jgi:ankyrin repeat protein
MLSVMSILTQSVAPLHKSNKNMDGNHNPSVFTKTLFPGRKHVRSPFKVEPPTDEQLEAYSMDIVRAIRESDLPKLQELLKDGHSFDACNRNGESLLHLACRRSDSDIAEFLINEAGVPTNVRDTIGRTVLHDICWRPRPDYKLMGLLIRNVSPDLLIAEDMRGHTCFDYSRKENWGEWVLFLKKHLSNKE